MHAETAPLPAHSFVYKGAPSSLSPNARAHSALSLSNVFFLRRRTPQLIPLNTKPRH